MNADEAIIRIAIHAGSSRDGIVGYLRPYRRIPDAFFSDLLHAMIVVHPFVVTVPAVDRILIGNLWSICHRTRTMALRSDSRIRRNALETAEGLNRLSSWIRVIEKFSIHLLHGHDLWVCLGDLIDFVALNGIEEPTEFEFLLPLLKECAADDDEEFLTTVSRAITVLSE